MINYLEHSANMKMIRKVNKRRLFHASDTIKYRMDEDCWNTEYDMCKWLDKYTIGKWSVEFLKVGFELQQDAVIFKLSFTS